MKVLITCGPTREPIDVIRFISNPSSGRMGAALAREAVGRGFEVTLVCGSVSVPFPSGCEVVGVTTTEEMIEAVLGKLGSSDFDIIISAAALSDFALEEPFDGKIESGRELTLTLKPVRKLLAEVRGKYPKLFVVGFKAEYGVDSGELVERAASKLKSLNLDLIVANDVSTDVFGSDENEVYVVDKAGTVNHIKRESKQKIAEKIWDTIEAKIT